jgi:hypothetical protein
MHNAPASAKKATLVTPQANIAMSSTAKVGAADAAIIEIPMLDAVRISSLGDASGWRDIHNAPPDGAQPHQRIEEAEQPGASPVVDTSQNCEVDLEVECNGSNRRRDD